VVIAVQMQVHYPPSVQVSTSSGNLLSTTVFEIDCM
jgi:hypothetical protein